MRHALVLGLLVASPAFASPEAPAPVMFSPLLSAPPSGVARNPYPVPPCEGMEEDPVSLPGPILGVQGGGLSTTLMPALGLTWTRTYIAWNAIQPTVDDPWLTVEEVRRDPAVLEDYVARSNWSGTDGWHRSLVDAGLDPFPVVGAGWYTSYATYEGGPATPDALGKDAYIAQLYRHTRAVVERYDGDGYLDADGIVIKNWQIENELNQAFLTALWGWRLPAFTEAFGSAWYDWGFITELLITLNEAVHDADPTALTVQNIHTDISPDINHMFQLPSWIEAAGLWRDHMDVVGFDAYPNYYTPNPVRGTVVGERVLTLKEASCGKNVIAMEVGYPAGPTELGFSEANQALFLQEAFSSVMANGAQGYFYFKLESTYQHDVEITAEDQQNMAMVSWLYDHNRLVPLTAWALRNIDYIEEHFLEVVQSVEPYWGLVDTAGNKKQSWYTMLTLAEQLDTTRPEQRPAGE